MGISCLVAFLNLTYNKEKYIYLAVVEAEIVTSDQERKIVFEAKVVVAGLKNIWAMRGRSRQLRITDSEILIENLLPIPLISIISCKIRFTFLQLEFVDKDGATTKLMIRAPLSYHFRPFPANYVDEHEFVENLYDAVMKALSENAALWPSLKDAQKELSPNKMAEIKRMYATQGRGKHILSLVLLFLTFSWIVFVVVTQILDLISLDDYETIVTLVLSLVFPIMIGWAFLHINRCPHCKALFINTPEYCRKCKVPFVDGIGYGYSKGNDLVK